MAYTKQTWQDLPSKNTPINASRLGHIEQGIYDAAATADTAASNASSAISGLADKVDKVEGKGLSTNDFTDALKTKLDNVEAGAEVNVQSDWDQSDNSADDYIKNKPSLGTSAYKNSTSVVTQSSDVVESGAVKDAIVGTVGWIGGRNKYDFTKNEAGSNNVDVVFTQTGVRAYTINNSQYASSEVLLADLDLENGKDYILIADVTYTKGVGKLAVRRGFGIVYQTSTITQNGKYTLPFTMASDLTRISLFVTLDNAIEGDITYDNIMILSAEDYTEDAPYEPYHESVADSLEEKADNSVIAPTENGATASQAYAVRSHFIRNGAFCTCIQAIAQGGTFTLNTNYTAGQVGDYINYTIPRQSITIGTTATYQFVIPEISGYKPFIVTPLIYGTYASRARVTVTMKNNSTVPEYINYSNTDSESRTWDISANIIYIKS